MSDSGPIWPGYARLMLAWAWNGSGCVFAAGIQGHTGACEPSLVPHGTHGGNPFCFVGMERRQLEWHPRAGSLTLRGAQHSAPFRASPRAPPRTQPHGWPEAPLDQCRMISLGCWYRCFCASRRVSGHGPPDFPPYAGARVPLAGMHPPCGSLVPQAQENRQHRTH
jgi:hypothetical protein